MVKWYNESLPRISRGFDYPWPHKIKAPDGAFYDCGQGASELLRLRVIETAGAMWPENNKRSEYIF